MGTTQRAGQAGGTAGGGAPPDDEQARTSEARTSEAGTTREAAGVLRAMVDARTAPASLDDMHLLVDVVLVASTLPDPQTALYAAERLHRAIDALPRAGADAPG